MNKLKTWREKAWDTLKEFENEFVTVYDEYAVFDDGVGWRWSFSKNDNVTLLALCRILKSSLNVNKYHLKEKINELISECDNEEELRNMLYSLFGDNLMWHFGGIEEIAWNELESQGYGEDEIEDIMDNIDLSFENFIQWFEENFYYENLMDWDEDELMETLLDFIQEQIFEEVN